MQHARSALCALALALALAGAVGACAFTPPPVEQVLMPELEPAGTVAEEHEGASERGAMEYGSALLVRVKAAALDALTAADEAPTSAAAQTLAARQLFEAAEVCLSCALLERLQALEAPSLEQVLAAEEGVDRATAEELVSLALEGGRRAERALELYSGLLDDELLCVHVFLDR